MNPRCVPRFASGKSKVEDHPRRAVAALEEAPFSFLSPRGTWGTLARSRTTAALRRTGCENVSALEQGRVQPLADEALSGSRQIAHSSSFEGVEEDGPGLGYNSFVPDVDLGVSSLDCTAAAPPA